ncbi:MAG: hypothetical protein KDI12_22445 [Anaerolineae bacterium]|nr:hypothetical protein [Anaerolineae bacterium]MCB9131979.1 hypothetical protein [Anaerolineales bacterium]HRX04069.1 DUF6504 family protein [Anaerolineae bacterium]
MQPTRFISEPIAVQFDKLPELKKKPDVPDRFEWRGEMYYVVELLSEWRDYSRRGRMAVNMRPEHAEVAASRGSWGVGRIYFRVRTEGDRVFDIYYDRAPRNADDRAGSWILFREMSEEP